MCNFEFFSELRQKGRKFEKLGDVMKCHWDIGKFQILHIIEKYKLEAKLSNGNRDVRERIKSLMVNMDWLSLSS